MKKWEKFSKEELANIVKNSYSYAQVCEQIGYKGGSGPLAVKEMIEHYNFDISHFKGQGWNKDNFNYERFTYGNNIKVAAALKALVHLKGHKCESCGLETWLDKPITLEIHHKDGDHLNNDIDNLSLLCPNCHSLTENWRGKNGRKHSAFPISDEDFAKALKDSLNIRQALLKLGLSAKGGNYARAREIIIKYNIVHLLES